MTSLDLTVLAQRQRYLLELVSDGRLVKDAARVVGMSPKGIQHWRERTPGYAELLDKARAEGRAWRSEHRRECFLMLVRQGMTAAAALRHMRMSSSAAQDWRRAYPSFDRRYRQLIQGRHHKARFRILLRELRAGASLPEAARRAGYNQSTPYRWQYRRPHLWKRIEAVRQQREVCHEG